MSLAAGAALALGAVIVGFSKTAIGGLNTIAIVLFALVLPAKESTGVLLVLLMVGDAVAVWSYRHAAAWALLRRLMLPVVSGVAVGAVFLAIAPTAWLKPLIGAIVVAMTALQAWRSRLGPQAGPPVETPGGAIFGSLAGFTTMVANAGGPVMSIYLLRSRLSVMSFVGSTAWFFACVNLLKLPVSIGLGLIRPQRLALCLALVPAVLVGAALGRLLIGRIPQQIFERVVLVVSGLSGLYLVLG